MGFVLLAFIIVAWTIGLRRYGYFSLVSAGLLGFSVYSIPAIVGLSYPFERYYTELTQTTSTSTLIILIAWIVFSLTISVQLKRRKVHGRLKTNRQVHDRLRTNRQAHSRLKTNHKTVDNAFIVSALILCVAGYMAIAVVDGPLFFLVSRDEQSVSYVRLLWRWINAIGFIAAIITGHGRTAIVFLTALIIYFLAGDRTVIIITAICVAIVSGYGQSLFRFFLTPRSIIGGIVMLMLAVFGKPIYLAVKAGSLDVLISAFDMQWLNRAVKTFEPFVQHNILDLVVRYNYQIPINDLFEGLLGQLLIIPSAFGFDSNIFNTEFMAHFGLNKLAYGIAGNYWAQGWAVGGFLGVAFFAFIYGVILRICNDRMRKYTGCLYILYALLGTMVAVYVHRNSMDNMLSFVRQIVIAILATVILAKFIRPIIKIKRIRILHAFADVNLLPHTVHGTIPQIHKRKHQ